MRKVIASFLTIVVMVVCFAPLYLVRAVESINISVSSDTAVVNKGGVLALNVVVDKMPNIMSFENINIDYDEISLSFEKATVSSELPESFAVSIDMVEEGLISISGLDETVKDAVDADLIENQDGSTEKLDENEDISFFSDSPVLICTLYFRVKAAAYEFASFSVQEGAIFTNTSYEEIEGVCNSEFRVDVTSDVSTDARIVALKVNGNALVDFKPDVYEYVLNVAKEVSTLEMDAELGNIFSTINYSSLDLAFGENVILIDVTAQDGVTTSQYKLVVTRQSSYLQEGANFVDNRGKLYSFVSAPSDVIIPEGFTETTAVINNFEVPCYKCEGVSQVLIYAFDGDAGETGLFFYDIYDRRVIAYNASTTIIRNSIVLNIVDVPKDVIIPEDFIPAKFIYNGKEYEGFINPEGEVICYMSNNAGKEMFYTYDYSSQTFIKYKPIDNSTENLYKLLFNVCLGIAIIESMAIIFIVYLIRRFRKERVNPRPRRV